MALSETTSIDKVEVIFQDGIVIIQVREATTVLRDGMEIAKTYNRYTVGKDADRANLPEPVKSIANTLFG